MSKPRERHPMPASPNSTKLETEMFQAKTINDSYGNYKYTQCLSADVVIQMTCQGYEPSIPQNDKIAGDFQCSHCENGYSDICDRFPIKCEYN